MFLIPILFKLGVLRHVFVAQIFALLGKSSAKRANDSALRGTLDANSVRILMPALTPKQENALRVLRQAERRGTLLSLRQFAAAVGVSSSATAHGMIQRLIRLGLLRRAPWRQQAFVVHRPATTESVSATELVMDGAAVDDEAAVGKLILDPKFFGMRSASEAICCRCKSKIETGDLTFRSADVIVLRRGYPERTGKFLALMNHRGSWRLGYVKANVRSGWITLPDGREVRPAAAMRLVRGHAVGIISRRGGRTKKDDTAALDSD